MLDLKALEKDPEGFEQKLNKRGNIEGLKSLLELVRERKSLIFSSQADQEKRNQASKQLSKATKEEIDEKRAELKVLSQNIKEKDQEVREIEEKISSLALGIPNILAEDVPVGEDESANVEVRKVGTPVHFDFKVKDHVELGNSLDLIDLNKASKVSGSRFAFLKGDGCRLSRALMLFFLDYHYKKGDLEILPPFLVNEKAMTNTGQFPKFKEDAFQAVGISGDPMYLIPTAEVPLTNYHEDEILEQASMPRRYFAYSPCFRAEAGAAGKDTRGLIRQHQFEKVEMVRFVTPEQAKDELKEMVSRAGTLLTELGLPFREVLLCAGDTGFSAEKTVDLEVWLPAQNTYREISSCSSFGAFQARRAKIRYRPETGEATKAKPELAVTLNGSGLPLGRTLVAILENHQQKDGSVNIPKVLQPYMGGQKVLKEKS